MYIFAHVGADHFWNANIEKYLTVLNLWSKTEDDFSMLVVVLLFHQGFMNTS